MTASLLEAADDNVEPWAVELPQDYIDEAHEALMHPEPNWPRGYRFDVVFSRPTTTWAEVRGFRAARFSLTDADREFLSFAAKIIVAKLHRRVRAATLGSVGT